ncbi:MAG TPA: hypothetical protein VHR41_13650 [Gemmatimonadales bacterium]|nr:hypothetical protein [Gemmatimonadales bacterium]
MYPAFKSVFRSTLLTEPQHTVTKALDSLKEKSPANAKVVSQFLPQLRAAQNDKDGLAQVTRDLFIALAPRDDVAAAEIHWHQCAWFMARLDQEFEWALRRSAEALLDRRMLEAILSGSHAGRTATEEDVVLTVSYQGDACGACRSTGGYESGSSELGTFRFTLAEARARSILPHTGCQRTVNGVPGFCRCRYKAV